MKFESFFLIAAVAFLLSSLALAQDHPAFAERQAPKFDLRVQVTDAERARDRAVQILTTKHGLTEAEALAKITSEGKVDLARCVEYIMLDALATLSPQQTESLALTDIVIRLEHPVEPAPVALRKR